MSIIKFSGIPRELFPKFLKKKANPTHFNPHIFKDIFEYKGFEIGYNSQLFCLQLEDEGKKEEAKKAIDNLYFNFLDKNPELFFNEVSPNKKVLGLSRFVAENSDKVEAKRIQYFMNKVEPKKMNQAEASLKFIQKFLNTKSYQIFDIKYQGIPMTKDMKYLLRSHLVEIIAVFGAKITKTNSGSITKFFIMDNPNTRNGNEFTVEYHDMPKYLKNKHPTTDSFITFKIEKKILKNNEGKNYNSKLYEELMTEEEKKEFGLEQVDEVLSLQQRRQRGQVMKRFAGKIALARKRSSKRMANMDHLEKRARHAAINIMRKRFAGALGVNYDNLSPGQKAEVDKKVEAKKNLIGRIAQKLLPKIKAKEITRLSGGGSTEKK